ncbi:MAG: hypothetical protein JJT76_00780 [Clostridiaceae bacterium]|nr:hypothetical protein [Clostridiaceae bacterium]
MMKVKHYTKVVALSTKTSYAYEFRVKTIGALVLTVAGTLENKKLLEKYYI